MTTAPELLSAKNAPVDRFECKCEVEARKKQQMLAAR